MKIISLLLMVLFFTTSVNAESVTINMNDFGDKKIKDVKLADEEFTEEIAQGVSCFKAKNYPCAQEIFEELLAEYFPPVTPAYYLGLMYDSGLGVPVDDELSVKYMMQAGKGGVPEAHAELAKRFFVGRGLPMDHRWAIGLMNRAQGTNYKDKNLKFLYAKYLYLGKVGVNEYSIDGNKKNAKRLFRDLYKQGYAAALGFHAVAKLDDALLYMESKPQKFEEMYRASFKMLKQAAKEGFPEAQLAYGRELSLNRMRRENYKPNLKKAYGFIQQAADQDHIEAKYLLGKAYYLGKGVAKDKAKSLEFFKGACMLGDKEFNTCNLAEVVEAHSQG